MGGRKEEKEKKGGEGRVGGGANQQAISLSVMLFLV
jgi:hypothetical protein